ncbi:hypothetical protein LEP1GSC064_0697 [Leptospira kirschneri serovar Grippotyphosa str. Moskva]|nr:hypothetical protein LEP1GSC064_0697 [Leptospira kirschneri serovar Grippotyphosa str. Moskva]
MTPFKDSKEKETFSGISSLRVELKSKSKIRWILFCNFSESSIQIFAADRYSLFEKNNRFQKPILISYP